MFRTIAIAAGLMTGALGAGTLAAQSTAPAKPAPQAKSTMAKSADTTMAHHWTKAQITEAQQDLAKAGYYKGKPSGTMDADTKKALKAFEKANGMPANGKLTDSVFAKLKTA
jgi:peptidoglycan hydrolase-like protein with peptidoglycan-binding domain